MITDDRGNVLWRVIGVLRGRVSRAYYAYIPYVVYGQGDWPSYSYWIVPGGLWPWAEERP